MNDPLQEVITNFGPPPRSFSLWDRLTYMRVRKPDWLSKFPKDQFRIHFKYASKALREGLVVWGHVIQANNRIFEPGSFDYGGELVYSLLDRNRATPEYLAKIATKLFDLKGTKPTDPALAEIANYLTNERIRVFGLAVPPTVSPTVRCQISTTFFHRKHLPWRRLCSSLLPIVVDPNEPNVALPVPQRYWPQELIDWWSK